MGTDFVKWKSTWHTLDFNSRRRHFDEEEFWIISILKQITELLDSFIHNRKDFDAERIIQIIAATWIVEN